MNQEQLNIPTPERPASLPNPAETMKGEPVSPEVQQDSIERGAERKEAASEARAVATDLASAAPVAPPVAIPSIPTPNYPSVSSSDDLDAADDNEIEKEWVDKAKKIISLTKGDPYQKEKQIVDVREEYQKKRFNRVRGENQQ